VQRDSPLHSTSFLFHPFHCFFLSPSLSLTLTRFASFNVCMSCCSVGADAVTPLRGPFPRAHTHVPGIRARACGYIRPPPRERAWRLARFLFEFPFGLPELRTALSLALCARVVVASTVLCPYLICAYCVSRMCARARACICV